MLVVYILALKISYLRKDISKKDYELKIKTLKKLPNLLKNTLNVES